MSVELEEQRRVVLEMAARLTEARKIYSQGLQYLQQENYQPAGEYITRAAEMGDSAAQCQLGFLYENGFFGETNNGEAIRWYKKSADQLLPQGQFRLGACFQLGKGVEQDWETSAWLFEQAANRGHSDAAAALQMLLDMGVEVPREKPGALRVAPVPVQRQVPPTVQDPRPVPKKVEAEVRIVSVEPEKPAPAPRREAPAMPPMPPLPPELDDPSVTDAVAAYQAQAMQNIAPAQLKLGLAYHVGRSVPADPKLACFWVMRSMLAGDATAAQYLQYCARAVPPEEHGAVQSKIFMWMPGQSVPQL